VFDAYMITNMISFSGGAMIITKSEQKEKLQHIYMCLHKKLQVNNKKI